MTGPQQAQASGREIRHFDLRVHALGRGREDEGVALLLLPLLLSLSLLLAQGGACLLGRRAGLVVRPGAYRVGAGWGLQRWLTDEGLAFHDLRAGLVGDAGGWVAWEAAALHEFEVLVVGSTEDGVFRWAVDEAGVRGEDLGEESGGEEEGGEWDHFVVQVTVGRLGFVWVHKREEGRRRDGIFEGWVGRCLLLHLLGNWRGCDVGFRVLLTVCSSTGYHCCLAMSAVEMI